MNSKMDALTLIGLVNSRDLNAAADLVDGVVDPREVALISAQIAVLFLKALARQTGIDTENLLDQMILSETGR